MENFKSISSSDFVAHVNDVPCIALFVQPGAAAAGEGSGGAPAGSVVASRALRVVVGLTAP
jgi:hypothetical protein